jgi:hypothetical protein
VKMGMVRPEGVEPPTYWFVASCSIQLSYGRTLQGMQLVKDNGIYGLEQTTEGFENLNMEKVWCARRDSNSRPFGSKPNALSS